MLLENQIKILGVDTGNFYSNTEDRLHWKIQKLRSEKRVIDTALKNSKKNKENAISLTKKETNNYQEDRDLIKINDAFYKPEQIEDMLKHKRILIKKTKYKLLKMLENKVMNHSEIRKLNVDLNSDKNIISIFESSLVRALDVKPDEFTDSLIVVHVFYFDVLKDIFFNGFEFNGKKYRYLTSSAGQIRTKKAVFIKEEDFERVKDKVYCGLSEDIINSKGGNNTNKHLSYLALSNSATTLWDNFNIHKTIVIDDFESDVYGEYDFIDDETYKIERRVGNITINHTDGAGMILPFVNGVKMKNRMVRLPFVKGLLGVFNFRKFIEEHNYSPIIKDIYGVEHDIIKEDIEIIFTKSQFKMWKYYDSWEHYKYCFEKYGCECGYANEESDRINNANLNYQMLQTLTDVSDDDILKIAKKSTDRLDTMFDSVENVKSLFGIDAHNTKLSYFQKAIDIYPNLINDSTLKIKIRQIKDFMVKRFKSGKLKIDGKYTFVLPDFFASCQYWFGKIENPSGLIGNGEVYCGLYKHKDKLDCLRSPHLFKEHAIRKNLAYRENEKSVELSKWFITKAIHISCKDMISRIVQCDFDGDVFLVVADDDFVGIAEKNMVGIVPLYYEMKKAKSEHITKESLYNGLISSFTMGNIGVYSNNISKIWNSEIFISGTQEEKDRAIDIIKILCMENNYCIDSAKTLYMPTRPKEIDEEISRLVCGKVPNFFIQAKDKNKDMVEDANDSVVNKISKLIKSPRVHLKRLSIGEIDYRLLMNNPDVDCKISFLENGKLDFQNTDIIFKDFLDLQEEYKYKTHIFKRVEISSGKIRKSSEREMMIKSDIIKKVKEQLLKSGKSSSEISDCLVLLMYKYQTNESKELLWLSFGKEMFHNLSNNLNVGRKAIQCKECGEWFFTDMKNKAQKYCDSCKEKILKRSNRERQRLYKERQKSKTIGDNVTV